MWLLSLYQQFQITRHSHVLGSFRFAKHLPVLCMTALSDWWHFRKEFLCYGPLKIEWLWSHHWATSYYLQLQGKCLSVLYTCLLPALCYMLQELAKGETLLNNLPPQYPDFIGLWSQNYESYMKVFDMIKITTNYTLWKEHIITSTIRAVTRDINFLKEL